jgi:simple sugar transport system ATP-binding protein
MDLKLFAGSVTGLVGENGAGKSSLVRALSGVDPIDGGRIEIEGQVVGIRRPADARQFGIETVFQDLALAPDLNAVENIFLGREVASGSFGVLRRNRMRDVAQRAMADIGARLSSLHIPVASLSGGQQQSVAIARALLWARHLVLLDEPTAALGSEQSRRVLALLRQMAARGLAVLFVSHDIPKVLESCDRVIVMRHGHAVGNYSGADMTHDALAGGVGR